MNLESLNKKLHRIEKVITYEFPDSPENLIFRVRALLPDEEASLNTLTLSDPDMRKVADVFLEKAKLGKEIETDDITDMIAEKMNNATQSHDRMLRTLLMGIVSIEHVLDGVSTVVDITNLTTKEIMEWNPSLLEELYTVISEELPLENDLHILRSAQEEIEEMEEK